MPYMGNKGDKTAARPPEGSLVETRCLKGPKSAIVPFAEPRSGPKSRTGPRVSNTSLVPSCQDLLQRLDPLPTITIRSRRLFAVRFFDLRFAIIKEENPCFDILLSLCSRRYFGLARNLIRRIISPNQDDLSYSLRTSFPSSRNWVSCQTQPL